MLLQLLIKGLFIIETASVVFQQQGLDGFWIEKGNRRKRSNFKVLKCVVWMLDDHLVLQRNSQDKKPDFNNSVSSRQTDDDDGGPISAFWSEHRSFQSDCTESAERHQNNQRLSFCLIIFHLHIFIWTPQTVCSPNISFCSSRCSWCCCFVWFKKKKKKLETAPKNLFHHWTSVSGFKGTVHPWM